ncbi:MAG: biosynthetic-type acetolactate synthase large subunit [Bacillota bacterium]
MGTKTQAIHKTTQDQKPPEDIENKGLKLEVNNLGDLNKAEVLKGAEILIKALECEGVDVVFGYPGGQILPVYDALYDSNLNHILACHEQGAVHAADGYARSTGRPGVVIATSGPGATNLVTGIANAYMDSVPMVAITGQVPLALVGRDSFQEADITGITLPITKHSYLVKDVRDLARVVHEAFYIATTGRPGPVLIDLPKDIANQTMPFPNYPPPLELPGYRVPKSGHMSHLPAIIRAIAESRRPVLFAGGGVITSGACPELQELAERMSIPVTTTMMGKGAFPETHPLSLGMVGMHGTAYANYALCECDLLIALGVRFDDRVTARLEKFVPMAKVIHVDIDPAEVGKNVQVDIAIVGDVRQVLVDLLKRAEQRNDGEWLERVNQWRKDYPLNYVRSDEVIKPQFVIEQIWELTRGDAFITTDVGQHQMWASQYYRVNKQRTFISSGGLGTMGFGLPAAIGVQVAHPEALVVDIAGDGSFQMNSQEMATAVRYRLPVKVALLNNGYLGMVRQWQELFYNRRYSQTDLSGGPDFVKLAEAYGAKGIRVTRPDQVRPALEEAFASPDTCLLDFVVEREENVFPMVPPGGTLDRMLGR